MARHDQKPYTTKAPFVCSECKIGACSACIDILRAVIPGSESLCQCTREGHDGEPFCSQIADPFNGSVHGPGAVISKDGGVTFDDDFIDEFKRNL